MSLLLEIIRYNTNKEGKWMYAFMTTGTSHFLKKITDKHPNIDFYFMRSGTSTLVYYENTKKKSIFVSGRTFSVYISPATYSIKDLSSCNMFL